jgi:hypothetical protein
MEHIRTVVTTLSFSSCSVVVFLFLLTMSCLSFSAILSVGVNDFAQFSMGQHVWLLNPRNQKQKVAAAVVSGIGGVDKYHGSTFPESWFKVDVKEALSPGIPLLYPNKAAEQTVLKDAVGSNALWDERFIKKA